MYVPFAVYVPVRQQASSELNNRQQITLKFRLATRDEDNTDPEPYWKIKISQLECQTTSTNWWKIKDIARQVWDWEEEEKDYKVKSKAYSLGNKRPAVERVKVFLNPVYSVRRFSTRRMSTVLHRQRRFVREFQLQQRDGTLFGKSELCGVL